MDNPCFFIFLYDSLSLRTWRYDNANGIVIRPETMGAVCAIVYLLALIFFIPFAFYKDIVAATSGGGNRDVVIEVEHVETGRMLHRFPHGKVCHFGCSNLR